MTTKKPKPTASATAEPAAFLLLDRSGSMSSMWNEALPAVNAYVKKLAEAFPKAKVTLALFDGENSYDVIRDAAVADTWKPVTNSDASPRGMTPLYDAILKLCAAAQKSNTDKTSIMIMTDGEENVSREATKDTAKTALDAARARGWDVIFLGANWDAMGQATDVGTQYANTMNFAPQNMTATMQGMASRHTLYSSGAMTANAEISESLRATGGFKSKTK